MEKKMVFDFENEEDVKDFFNIWKEQIVKARRTLCDSVELLDKNNNVILRIQESLIDIIWGEKECIERQIDTKKWIGKLCWFYENEKTERSAMGILKEVYTTWNGEKRYKMHNDTSWRKCEPVKKSKIELFEE